MADTVHAIPPSALQDRGGYQVLQIAQEFPGKNITWL
jgi:hypothetical protein